jgi:amino acid adenylation domain-containing protein
LNAADLLAQLKSLGIDLVVDGGRLRVSAARGQLTAELKAAIATHKAEILALLATATPEVPRIPRDEPLPLSFFQERLWVQSQFEPDSTAYNMVAGWESPGPVDAAAVVEALGVIVRRHEILRASFRERGGIPFVALLPPETVPVQVRDLLDVGEEEQRAELRAATEKATHTPFDLRGAPPIRFTVYRVAGGKVITLAAAHHIAMDAWSFALLGREIVAAYEGKEPPAPGDLSYVDFAAWQRNLLKGPAVTEEVEWWKRRLAGSPRTSTLRADRPRARQGTGATRPFMLDRELAEGVRALVREERATVYMALVSACAALLHWHTGQEDVVIGSPMGQRERPEFEGMLGPFVSLLVLRIDLSGDPTFAQILERTRATLLDAHEHRQVPFEKIVERLNPERSVDHAPLFQVAVVQHNANAEGVPIASGGALFDLTWFVREENGGYACGLEYRSDRFLPETIDKVASRLDGLLRRAVENRHLRLSDLNILDPLESPPSRRASSTFRPPADRSEAETSVYFQRQMKGAQVLELPADRPRSLRKAGARARETVTLPGAAMMTLLEVGRANGASPFAVSLATFEVLLHRYSGQSDLTVSVPFPEPTAFSAGPAIALPVRVPIQPDAPFAALLQAVRSAVFEGYSRRQAPQKLKAALAHARAELQLPAPAVFYGFGGQDAPADDAFDLAVSVIESDEGQALAIEYDPSIFEAATIQRLAGHYRTLVEGLAADPALPVSRIPLMASGEREAVLAAVRRDGGALCTTPVVRLFEEQVARTPDATAVIDAATSLSYRKLDRAANHLARRLQALGAGPGLRVAVSLERSASVVIALLAVLRVGASYVPVDPHYPPERGAYVLEDAQPVVLLTENEIRGRVPVPSQVAVLCIDPDTLPDEQADAAEVPPPDPDAIAYVLYTSGSTGRPKGVEIPNRALSNFLASMQHTPGLTAEDRLLSVTTISFDIAGLEIFLPLITGARVQIVAREVTMDGVRLADLIDRSGATVMQATPATWRMLIEAGWKGNDHLKILCGGEAMPRELATQLLARAGSVWNMYGPTETTIWSTLHRVGADEGPVSIGAPIDNTPVYVLDAHGEVLPFGVPGELFIGGAGVARGYLHRRELTASRFVADPFAGGEARMYRTGDAARLRPDGTLDYYGRLDHQVKIRGHRIELGEIEAVLREHPHVSGVVVVAREFTPGDVRLVGYYVPREAGVTARELRELCQRKLPKDVIPTAWMALTAIPLTPNGKTDSKALPAPDPNAQADDVERVPPRDALETQLASIWEAVLETKVQSIRDRFFDIGGHSLLAIRLFARIEQATGVALPLASLVEGGTIEQMATSIRERQLAANPQEGPQKSFSYLVPIRAQGSRAPLFCVHGAGGNVLNFRDIGRHLSPDRPFYGIQAAGVDGTTRPMTTVEEMAENYLEELRSIQPRGPYYLSGYCGGGIVAYEIAQRLLAAGEEVAILVLIDAARPGSIVLESKRRRWSRTLVEESLPLLLKRAAAKFSRELVNTVENLQIRYHLSRGVRMPFVLRERWLIECFLQAILRYQLQPYAGRITVLRARAADPLLGEPGEDLGWAVLARDGVESHEIPGDHHSLTLEPNVQVLAAQLEACIRAAENEAPPASVIDDRPRRGVAA